MTTDEAEWEFRGQVERAMLKAWKNGVSRQHVIANLLLLISQNFDLDERATVQHRKLLDNILAA